MGRKKSHKVNDNDNSNDNSNDNTIISFKKIEIISVDTQDEDINDMLNKTILKNIYCKCGTKMKLIYINNMYYFFKCPKSICRNQKKIMKKDVINNEYK